MKIVIVGAGAMGSLLGSYLSKHNDVILVDIWEDHVNAINKNGITVDEKDGTSWTAKPKAFTSSQNLGQAELLVLFVKSVQTYDALKLHQSLIGPHTVVLSLQNGFGNAEDIQQFVNENHTIIGTTSHGCTMLGPGHIKHAGSGPTHIGAMGRDQEKADQVAKVLNESGFETDVKENVLTLVWDKLFVNVGINAITTVLQRPNQVIAENPEAKKLSHMLVKEAVNVANARGESFEAENVFRNVLKVSQATGENHSSMFADFEHKRKTEILKINGAIVQEAEKAGMKAPYNELMTAIVSAIEAEYSSNK